ncbi:MAG TPA: glycerophosphodiester phosphodiesterase [Pyrinomonadaceae bacterium]|nr:glycerophosphodiester phosphodiesterase [Pyrinomonadaceae bacterium]
MAGRRRVKIFLALVLCGFAMLGALYGGLAWSAGKPARAHPFFAGPATPARPLVIAHRGGAGLWPENTLHAFERAAELGADVLELDVRSSADGEMVVVHDATLERTTDGAGRVADKTVAELKRLDAGHRWTADGGRTFPFRGRGLTVPTLREVFERLPGARFNIEPKDESSQVVGRLCRLIRERGMAERVVVGSFRQSLIEEFRRACPEVATAAGPVEAGKFLALYQSGLAASFSPAMQALQIPEYAGGVRVVTKEFVAAARERNLQVHAWTINDEAAMRRLIEAGADGIMTDYPDRLLALLGRAKPAGGE